MRITSILLLTLLVLSACTPSVESVQTAIAETQASWTPVPTQTPYPTYTPFPTETFTPEPTSTPDGQAMLSNLITSFKNAGLEAEGAYLMGPQDYGAAPFVCQGVRFLVPSLGANSGGRAFVCNNPQELSTLAAYYNDLGRSNALFFSWVFVKNNILVQINGELPEATARLYEAAIP